MKRITTLLIILCCITSSMNAQSKEKSVNTPKNVIYAFDYIINNFGEKKYKTYSINKNPNTNLIESSEKIIHFNIPFPSDITEFDATVDPNFKAIEFRVIENAFAKDETISYQILHLSPGSNERFKLKVVTNNGQKAKDVQIRTSSQQEMWFMCTKNPTNPELRDAYAIVWEVLDDHVEGDIFMISSLRPDIYTKAIETSNTFKIVGRVDPNITDSLYNIYIADSREELRMIGDDDYIACVPVVNKRFEYQVELDHPVAGRLRCIFPDGSLCSAYIDLDFVPGETYHITVHNGYYDEDIDYERRVGSLSGKSLINKKSNSNNKRRDGDVGIDSTVDINADINNIMDFNMMAKFVDEKDKIIAVSEILPPMMTLIENVKKIQDKYEFIKNGITNNMYKDSDINRVYNDIIKLNKDVDVKMDYIFDTLRKVSLDKSNNINEFKKTKISMFQDQIKTINGIYKDTGHMSKSAIKCQKNLNKLIEKNMN